MTWQRLSLAAVPAGLFAVLAALISSAPRDAPDRRVEDAVHRYAVGHPVAADAARVLTYLGNTAVLAALLVATAVLLARGGRRRAAVLLLAVPALAWAAQSLIKLVMARPRPVFANPIAHAPGWSFPSGHATDSTAAYGTLVMVLATRSAARRLASAAAAVLVLVVCTTRVVLGVHWLSDVVAGVLLSGTALIVASAFMPRGPTPLS
jgi:membrane-associated phospholipid phosphatase